MKPKEKPYPIALVRQGTNEVVAYACGQCGEVPATTFEYAIEKNDPLLTSMVRADCRKRALNHCGPSLLLRSGFRQRPN